MRWKEVPKIHPEYTTCSKLKLKNCRTEVGNDIPETTMYVSPGASDGKLETFMENFVKSDDL